MTLVEIDLEPSGSPLAHGTGTLCLDYTVLILPMAFPLPLDRKLPKTRGMSTSLASWNNQKPAVCHLLKDF